MEFTNGIGDKCASSGIATGAESFSGQTVLRKAPRNMKVKWQRDSGFSFLSKYCPKRTNEAVGLLPKRPRKTLMKSRAAAPILGEEKSTQKSKAAPNPNPNPKAKGKNRTGVSRKKAKKTDNLNAKKLSDTTISAKEPTPEVDKINGELNPDPPIILKTEAVMVMCRKPIITIDVESDTVFSVDDKAEEVIVIDLDLPDIGGDVDGEAISDAPGLGSETVAAVETKQSGHPFVSSIAMVPNLVAPKLNLLSSNPLVNRIAASTGSNMIASKPNTDAAVSSVDSSANAEKSTVSETALAQSSFPPWPSFLLTSSGTLARDSNDSSIFSKSNIASTKSSVTTSPRPSRFSPRFETDVSKTGTSTSNPSTVTPNDKANNTSAAPQKLSRFASRFDSVASKASRFTVRPTGFAAQLGNNVTPKNTVGTIRPLLADTVTPRPSGFSAASIHSRPNLKICNITPMSNVANAGSLLATPSSLLATPGLLSASERNYRTSETNVTSSNPNFHPSNPVFSNFFLKHSVNSSNKNAVTLPINQKKSRKQKKREYSRLPAEVSENLSTTSTPGSAASSTGWTLMQDDRQQGSVDGQSPFRANLQSSTTHSLPGLLQNLVPNPNAPINNWRNESHPAQSFQATATSRNVDAKFGELPVVPSGLFPSTQIHVNPKFLKSNSAARVPLFADPSPLSLPPDFLAQATISSPPFLYRSSRVSDASPFRSRAPPSDANSRSTDASSYAQFKKRLRTSSVDVGSSFVDAVNPQFPHSPLYTRLISVESNSPIQSSGPPSAPSGQSNFSPTTAGKAALDAQSLSDLRHQQFLLNRSLSLLSDGEGTVSSTTRRGEIAPSGSVFVSDRSITDGGLQGGGNVAPTIYQRSVRRSDENVPNEFGQARIVKSVSSDVGEDMVRQPIPCDKNLMPKMRSHSPYQRAEIPGQMNKKHSHQNGLPHHRNRFPDKHGESTDYPDEIYDYGLEAPVRRDNVFEGLIDERGRMADRHNQKICYRDNISDLREEVTDFRRDETPGHRDRMIVNHRDEMVSSYRDKIISNNRVGMISDHQDRIPDLQNEAPEFRNTRSFQVENQNHRNNIPELRERIPDLRERIPDLRERIPDLREIIPGHRERVSGHQDDTPEFRNEHGHMEKVFGQRDRLSDNRNDNLSYRDERTRGYQEYQNTVPDFQNKGPANYRHDEPTHHRQDRPPDHRNDVEPDNHHERSLSRDRAMLSEIRDRLPQRQNRSVSSECYVELQRPGRSRVSSESREQGWSEPDRAKYHGNKRQRQSPENLDNTGMPSGFQAVSPDHARRVRLRRSSVSPEQREENLARRNVVLLTSHESHNSRGWRDESDKPDSTIYQDESHHQVEALEEERKRDNYGRFICHLCEVSFPYKKQYYFHLKTKRHTDREEELRMESHRDQPFSHSHVTEEEEAGYERAEGGYKHDIICHMCEMSFPYKKTYYQHLKTKRHTDKEEEMTLESRLPQPRSHSHIIVEEEVVNGRVDGAYKQDIICHLCEMSFPSKKDYYFHTKTKRHTDREEEIKMESHPDRQRHRSRETEEQRFGKQHRRPPPNERPENLSEENASELQSRSFSGRTHDNLMGFSRECGGEKSRSYAGSLENYANEFSRNSSDRSLFPIHGGSRSPSRKRQGCDKKDNLRQGYHSPCNTFYNISCKGQQENQRHVEARRTSRHESPATRRSSEKKDRAKEGNYSNGTSFSICEANYVGQSSVHVNSKVHIKSLGRKSPFFCRKCEKLYDSEESYAYHVVRRHSDTVKSGQEVDPTGMDEFETVDAVGIFEETEGAVCIIEEKEDVCLSYDEVSEKDSEPDDERCSSANVSLDYRDLTVISEDECGSNEGTLALNNEDIFVVSGDNDWDGLSLDGCLNDGSADGLSQN